MVGVPGRSKGCHTCKSRKIRCDQQQPQCGQCLKSKRVCGGYRRETIFKTTIFGGQQGRQAAGRVQKPSTAQGSTISNRVIGRIGGNGQLAAVEAAVGAPAAALVPIRTHGTSSRLGSGASSRDNVEQLVVPSPQPEVHHGNAVRTQLLAWFIDNFIPEAEKTAYGCSARRRPISWLQVASALPESGDCLSTALAALSAARLGRLHHNRQLAMESKGLYVTALSRLQAALYDPRRMYRDEALASCMALELFELLECPEDKLDGWFAHLSGLGSLVQSRGPHLHTSRASHDLFLSFRLTEIIRGCVTCKATFLAEPEWRVVPWMHMPKSEDDMLLDVMAQIPGLLEEANSIKSMDDVRQVLAARLSLINHCLALHAQFQQWYEMVHAPHPSSSPSSSSTPPPPASSSPASPSLPSSAPPTSATPPYWAEFSTMGNPADDPLTGKVFPTALHFPNMRIAVRYLHYWAAMILLCSTMLLAYRALQGVRRDYSLPDHPADLRRCPTCSKAPGLVTCQCGFEGREDAAMGAAMGEAAMAAGKAAAAAAAAARTAVGTAGTTGATRMSEVAVEAATGMTGSTGSTAATDVTGKTEKEAAAGTRTAAAAAAAATTAAKGTDPASIGARLRALPPPPTGPAELYGFGASIAQSAEYCLRPEMGSFGAVALLFPLRTAAQNFRYNPAHWRELAWCRAALDAVSLVAHLPFSRRLYAAAWGSSADPDRALRQALAELAAATAAAASSSSSFSSSSASSSAAAAAAAAV